jgi:exopolysaccharide production protein ExoQ
MAIDQQIDGDTPTSWFDQVVFLAFLLLVFVGLKPFMPPPPEVDAFGAQGMTGSGDVLRQIGYILVFVAILIAAVRKRGWLALAEIPVPLLLLMLWCFVSTLWAVEPGVAVRRAGLATIVLFCACLSVRSLPPARALALWRGVLLVILLVNLVSIRFIAEAVHQAGEADPALVGNWRGLYGHKNIAGAVGAMTALLFLFAPRRAPVWPKKLFDLAVAGLAVFFVVGSHSKSSLGLMVVALLCAIVYKLAWQRGIDRSITVTAVLAALVAGATILIADEAALAKFFSDPTEFTGRTEIWKAEIAYFFDHPLLGAGFGSFADTGAVSPLRNYASAWVTAASHGHNGYLQILVTLGGVGIVLAFAALIVQPAYSFWRRDDNLSVKAGLFALFVFFLAHNMMESDFLEADGTAWVAYLLMLTLLRPQNGEALP